MRQRYGILLLDNNEIVFRIYEVVGSDWKLLHVHSTQLETTHFSQRADTTYIMERIAEFFSTEPAQHIAEWKNASRNLPQEVTHEIAHGLGITIETITPDREQELLCKGLFTELW